MFKEFKIKYSIDKDYSKEADLIKQDIDYLLMHYYRSRSDDLFADSTNIASEVKNL